jgi:hypothetical protein
VFDPPQQTHEVEHCAKRIFSTCAPRALSHVRLNAVDDYARGDAGRRLPGCCPV